MEYGDRDLPRLVARIPKARPAHDSLPRFWGEVVQPRQAGNRDRFPDPLTASGVVPAGASALEPEAMAPVLPVLDPSACTGCGRCWSACPDSAIGVTALGGLLADAGALVEHLPLGLLDRKIEIVGHVFHPVGGEDLRLDQLVS